MKKCIIFIYKLLVCLYLNENIFATANNLTNTTLPDNSLSTSSDQDNLNVTGSDRANNTIFTIVAPSENISASLNHTYTNATAAYNETSENSTEVTNLVTTLVSPTGPTLHHTFKNTHVMADRKRNQLCDCDLTFGSCDINCCCDHDCSSEDNLTFNQCVNINPSYLPHSHYCTQTRLIYKNNAPYHVRATSNNLFCITQDNVEQQYRYLSEKFTLDHLMSMTTKNHFSWDDLKEDKRHGILKEMKVGTELYILDENHKIQIWGFPASLFSAECQVKQNVTYLVDQKTTCNLKIDLTAPPCSQKSLNASSHHGFYLLRNPALLNESAGIQIEPCQENITCMLVTPAENYTCLDGSDSPHVHPLLDGHLPSPEFDAMSGVCHNVVTKVTYQIVHNGTSGLINATVLFQLETIDARSQYVNQIYETAYIWNNRLNVSFVRSGNPGYIVGRPILAGRKTVMNITNEQIDIIQMNKDATKWLTIVKAHHNGICTAIPENRATVTFGENLMSACIFKFTPQDTQSCDNLQKMILTLINGTFQPDSVGYFGNSNNHNVSEWIPIHFLNSLNVQQSDKYVCHSIITDLHVEIYHAATGTISEPQQKIFGVVFQYRKLQDINLNCTEDVAGLCRKEVILTSSVNFKDISQPAIQLFGQFPSLHASVPGDFFYPFTFSKEAHFLGNAFLLFILVLCVVTL